MDSIRLFINSFKNHFFQNEYFNWIVNIRKNFLNKFYIVYLKFSTIYYTIVYFFSMLLQ